MLDDSIIMILSVDAVECAWSTFYSANHLTKKCINVSDFFCVLHVLFFVLSVIFFSYIIFSIVILCFFLRFLVF